MCFFPLVVWKYKQNRWMNVWMLRASTQTALWIISTQPSGEAMCLKEWNDAHYFMVSSKWISQKDSFLSSLFNKPFNKQLYCFERLQTSIMWLCESNIFCSVTLNTMNICVSQMSAHYNNAVFVSGCCIQFCLRL